MDVSANQALQELLRELAAADAPAVLERARSQARARAEQLIEQALVDELLAAAAALRRTPTAPRPEPHARPDEQARDQAEPGEAWWTYCIIRAEDASVAPGCLEGVEPGSAVEVIGDGDLAALVSSVPLAEYGDERLREHLEDLEWVERTARRHEDVLEAALREATIVPLRLCTLYHDRDGVRRLLREHADALHDGLSRVDGCVEWGVKVFVDPHVQAGPVPAESAESESRGATYLLRRQQERTLAEKASEVRARCVEAVHQRVGALARNSVTNPPQRPEVHGRELMMLLNGAYLIERARTAELHEAVAVLQEEWHALGFAIELTGPWPPYNSVSGAAGVLS